MQVQRTSSSRKARRKNEHDGGKGHTFSVNAEEGSTANQCSSWRKDAKFWILKVLKNATTFLLAFCCSVFYFVNTSQLFENTTKFSQQTSAERELVLPTEVAFRYRFFKKIANSDSYLSGLRLITTDQNEFAANSFQRHSLTPEALLGGGFHIVKALSNWIGWHNAECQGGAEDRESCSGLGDPLYFYLKSIWTLESLVLILIFYHGLRFGKSILGGIIAPALFILLHPQRFNHEWLFPLRDKMGWTLVFSQLYCVSRTIFCRVHPPWKSTVKIGVLTTLLILIWNTEAQWFLSSQVLIVAVLHIFGFFSRYVTSLVIFGQLTGWQYASFVSLDTSFHHWSFFLYAIVATIVTVFMLGPILDWILGKKIEKWLFFRRTVLLVTLQLVLISVRCDLGAMFSLAEDTRFPLSISMLQTDVEPTWKNIDYHSIQGEADINTSILPHSLRVQQEEADDGDFIHENIPLSDSNEWDAEDEESHEKVDLMAKRTKDMLSLQLNEFLRGCFKSQGRISVGKFLSKYFFLIFASVYSLFVCVVMPWLMSKSSERQRRGAVDVDETSGSSWNFSKTISSSFPLLSHLDKGGDQRMDMEEENCRWNALLTYHIAQTGAFAFFCLSLDKRCWEIFFVSHASLVISLLCDFQKIRQTLDKCQFNYASHLHFGVVVVIMGILVASSRLRSTQMYLKSRGRFEIDNPRLVGLMEAHQWIKLNTKSSANFTGGDNLMVTLGLATERHSVNHHLTVHSWARENNIFEEFPGDERKILSEVKSRSRPENPGESRQSESKGGKTESTKWNGMRGLDSKPSGDSGGSSWTIRHQDESGGGGTEVRKRRGRRMTSLLTPNESESLEKIFSMFSRSKSFSEFHKDLVFLQVTHLMLSSDANQCLTEHTSVHLPLVTLSTTQSRIGGSSAGILVESGNLRQNSSFISGTWEDPTKKSHDSQNSFPHFSKNCDLVQFWDFVERKVTGRVSVNEHDRQNSKSHQKSLTKNFDSNVKGSKFPATRKINEQGEDGKSNEAQAGSNMEEPTLCRLLNERNVLPFKRVFQNEFFTILSI